VSEIGFLNAAAYASNAAFPLGMFTKEIGAVVLRTDIHTFTPGVAIGVTIKGSLTGPAK
jgi:hypothetical protein